MGSLGTINIRVWYSALAQAVGEDFALRAPPDHSGWRWEMDLHAVPIW